MPWLRLEEDTGRIGLEEGSPDAIQLENDAIVLLEEGYEIELEESDGNDYLLMEAPMSNVRIR